MTAPITIVTPASDQFWAHFGDDHINNILNLDPAPQHVTIISETPLNLPNGWTNLPLPQPVGTVGWVAAACNHGNQHATTDWVIYKPVDDLLDPDIFQHTVYQGDAINIGGRYHLGNFSGTTDSWNNTLTLSRNPMPGLILIQRATALQIPYRPVYFDDWMFWIDLKAHGGQATIQFGPHWTWRHHNLSFTQGTTPIPIEANQQIQTIQTMYQTGQVRPAAEWPPTYQENPT